MSRLQPQSVVREGSLSLLKFPRTCGLKRIFQQYRPIIYVSKDRHSYYLLKTDSSVVDCHDLLKLLKRIPTLIFDGYVSMRGSLVLTVDEKKYFKFLSRLAKIARFNYNLREGIAKIVGNRLIRGGVARELELAEELVYKSRGKRLSFNCWLIDENCISDAKVLREVERLRSSLSRVRAVLAKVYWSTRVKFVLDGVERRLLNYLLSAGIVVRVKPGVYALTQRGYGLMMRS